MECFGFAQCKLRDERISEILRPGKSGLGMTLLNTLAAAQSDVLLSSRCYLLASLNALDEGVVDSICGNLGE